MPLHPNAKGACLGIPDPLDYPIKSGNALDFKTGRDLIYSLGVERIYHYLTATTCFVEHTVFCSHHEVTFTKFMFYVPFTRHAMVIEAFHFVHAVVKSPSHSHIYFLNAAAGAKYWNPLFYAFPDQWHHSGVAGGIAHLIIRERRSSIMVWFDISSAASKHKSIKAVSEICEVVVSREGRDYHRDCISAVGHAPNITFTDAMLR